MAKRGSSYFVEIAPTGWKPVTCITKKLTGGKDRALFVTIQTYMNAVIGYYQQNGVFPKKAMLPNLDYDWLLDEDGKIKPINDIVHHIQGLMREIEVRVVVSQLPQSDKSCQFIGCGRRGTEVGYFFTTSANVIRGVVNKTDNRVDKELITC